MSWLARLKNLQTPEGHATKPTEPGFVGFVAPHPGVLENSSVVEVPLRPRQVGSANSFAVISAKAPELTQERPYKLTREQLHAAHAEPWSEAVIARYQARTAAIQRHGYGEQDAEDLAERLHLRDVDGDRMVMCVECSRYRPGRCGNHRAAGLMVSELARAVTVMFQDCPGFGEVVS